MRYIFCIVFIVCSTTAAWAVEHQVGVVAGKEIGVVYTQHRNRWQLSADAGMLTGADGARIAVNGGYMLINSNKLAEVILTIFPTSTPPRNPHYDMQCYIGVGAYGQYLHRTSMMAQQMDYDTPFGMQMWTQMSYVFKQWEVALHITLPVILDDKNKDIRREMDTWKKCLYIFQLSVQYKFNFSTNSVK